MTKRFKRTLRKYFPVIAFGFINSFVSSYANIPFESTFCMLLIFLSGYWIYKLEEQFDFPDCLSYESYDFLFLASYILLVDIYITSINVDKFGLFVIPTAVVSLPSGYFYTQGLEIARQEIEEEYDQELIEILEEYEKQHHPTEDSEQDEENNDINDNDDDDKY